jgi:hypothetical protein
MKVTNGVSERSELRLEAIELVLKCRPVLTDSDFLRAMSRATDLYPATIPVSTDKDGMEPEEETLMQRLFGNDGANGVESALDRYETIKEVMAYNPVPVLLRSFYCDAYTTTSQSWELFKAGFELK